MLSNIAVFCPAMTEPIRMTSISAVARLDLRALQEKGAFPLLQEKAAGGEDPPLSALGAGPHVADPDRIFLPCFQCGLFHSVAVEGVGGPAYWCIYSFIYSFF